MEHVTQHMHVVGKPNRLLFFSFTHTQKQLNTHSTNKQAVTSVSAGRGLSSHELTLKVFDDIIIRRKKGLTISRVYYWAVILKAIHAL